MKKFVIVVTIFLISAGLVVAETHLQMSLPTQITGVKPDLIWNFNLTEGVEVVFSVNELLLEEQLINGEMLKTIQLSGIFLPNDEGAPNLPGTGRYVAMPQGANASYQIVSFRTEKYDNIDIAPAPRIPWENEDGPLEYQKNLTIYSADTYYPASPVKLSEKTQIRGVDVVLLGITPFQYNPVTKGAHCL